MRKNLWVFVGLLGNLLTFTLLLLPIVFSGMTEWEALWVGAGLGVGGILLTVFSHLVTKDHPVSWLLSILLLGASKGGCVAAILIKCYPELETGDARLVYGAVLSAVGMLLLCMFFSLLQRVPAIDRHSKAVFFPLMILLVAGAITLLVVFKEPFFVLLLIESITLLFCWGAGLLEADEAQEIRFNLNIASMLYAIAVFLIALMLIAGDGCDDCGCEGCDCGGGGEGGGKKKKK